MPRRFGRACTSDDVCRSIPKIRLWTNYAECFESAAASAELHVTRPEFYANSTAVHAFCENQQQASSSWKTTWCWPDSRTTSK